MTPQQQKVTQYLNEALVSERGLVRELQAQIAMTPRGAYRSALETHLRDTRDHADRVGSRLRDLGHGRSPIGAAVGLIETAAVQTLALGRAPIALLRGASGEEKVLKNAKDACATEALEIATYTAHEELARAVGDRTTAKLAASIRADEEQMLERVLDLLPDLTAAVVASEINDDPSYDVGTTGAADTVRDIGDAAKDTAERTADATRRTARTARKVPGVARAEGQIKGAVASEGDLAVAGYDDLTADDIVARLPGLSQIELARIDSYERRHQQRTTVLNRTSALRGDEPWPGYDELTAADVKSRLADGDEDLIKTVRQYERSHKNRAGVLEATERELSNA